MAIAITRDTIIGVAEETTEGTYEAPLVAELLQINGFPTMAPTRELLDRNLIKGSIGKLKPLKGMRAGTMEVPFELRAGGQTGGVSDEPEISLVLESILGNKTNPTNSTTDVGSTATDIVLLAGEGATWARGDLCLILGEARFVLSVAGDTLTLVSALDKGAPASGVDVRAGWSYSPASSGHKPLSITTFLQDDSATDPLQFRAIGCRASAASIANFLVGQIPTLNTTWEMLDWAEATGALPGTPAYNQTLPPVVLDGVFQKDDTVVRVGDLTLDIAQTVERQLDINSTSGTFAMFIGDRTITGQFSPFLDFTTIAIFTEFDDNTSFELQTMVAATDSTGDFTQGTTVAIWLPNNIFTESNKEDSGGVVKRVLPFQSHEDAAIATGDNEIYIAFV